ncbi:helix-turn-helix transcriptional regulator [Frigoribacterium sp. CG_9.8]|uniref:helix-turn-helix transcriptional regulator n=1 Tax=Frigoribacterium sp. CG_9.8 TaxID=2787733 RepID=UPI0018C8D7A9|nr:helix-turn-helix transcriptional regulator [Frigoribacterium sp. CG_9.8]MBG6107609.1 DNA-binding PadR family transcriptional regulator [Frigoribacterium sp. CG_9.8]
MSSIRLFILGSLAERGPMHGHGLLLLAEEEHIDEWTDFAPSAVYGAMKRLAAEGLLVTDRVEKHGNYPKRHLYRISESGELALSLLRTQGLTELAIKPDPLDLALARLDPGALDNLSMIIEERLAQLRDGAASKQAHLEEITRYLTVAETWAMRHQLSRWRSEADWHEELLAALPEIIADEKSRAEKSRRENR